MNPHEPQMPPVLDEGERVLMKVFASKLLSPFTDDYLVVGENKITRVRRELLSSRITQTLQYGDISEVATIETMLSASLRVTLKTPGSEPMEIANLKKNEARKARRIIEGMVIVTRDGIDTSKYPIDEFSSKIENLGKIE